MIFVDLIDCHIETDIVCGSIADVLHDSVVGVTTNFIMALLISVQAQKNQICFWEINGKRSVRNYVDDEKTHVLCFYNQISESAFAIFPKKCFATAEEQNANSHVI